MTNIVSRGSKILARRLFVCSMREIKKRICAREYKKYMCILDVMCPQESQVFVVYRPIFYQNFENIERETFFSVDSCRQFPPLSDDGYLCLMADNGELLIFSNDWTNFEVINNKKSNNSNVLIEMKCIKKYTDKHGEVCPAGWKPGKKTMNLMWLLLRNTSRIHKCIN